MSKTIVDLSLLHLKKLRSSYFRNYIQNYLSYKTVWILLYLFALVLDSVTNNCWFAKYISSSEKENSLLLSLYKRMYYRLYSTKNGNNIEQGLNPNMTKEHNFHLWVLSFWMLVQK